MSVAVNCDFCDKPLEFEDGKYVIYRTKYLNTSKSFPHLCKNCANKLDEFGIDISSIPEDFWPVFVGELYAVFGGALFVSDEFGASSLLYLTGICGWNLALKRAYNKTGLSSLYKQYSKMPWYVSDEIDGQLADKIMEGNS